MVDKNREIDEVKKLEQHREESGKFISEEIINAKLDESLVIPNLGTFTKIYSEERSGINSNGNIVIIPRKKIVSYTIDEDLFCEINKESHDDKCERMTLLLYDLVSVHTDDVMTANIINEINESIEYTIKELVKTDMDISMACEETLHNILTVLCTLVVESINVDRLEVIYKVLDIVDVAVKKYGVDDGYIMRYVGNITKCIKTCKALSQK